MSNQGQKTSILTSVDLEKFRKDGFLVVPNILSDQEITSMKNACHRIVEEMNPSEHARTIFNTTDNDQGRSDYFLDSGDKIRFFFEEEALDENKELKVDKHLAINKIGHALHWWVPEFKEVSFSPKIKTISGELGFKRPALVQSMYIFKQPGFGGEVTPHKDSTFLSTEPQSCIGLWFALEDATEENGCLWFSPGSHRNPTERRFIRNPDRDGPLTIFTSPPDPHDPSKYVSVPVKRGTLVLIDGQVDHMSAKNTSKNSRHIYTFHIIEKEGVKWDERNWLQPTDLLPFTELYEN
ncbi:UNVERIFIED_CONTAM: hypothetical protein RMT77_015472 [Armadillidium vulgare]